MVAPLVPGQFPDFPSALVAHYWSWAQTGCHCQDRWAWPIFGPGRRLPWQSDGRPYCSPHPQCAGTHCRTQVHRLTSGGQRQKGVDARCPPPAETSGFFWGCATAARRAHRILVWRVWRRVHPFFKGPFTPPKGPFIPQKGTSHHQKTLLPHLRALPAA